jgi:hypothetical protein
MGYYDDDDDDLDLRRYRTGGDRPQSGPGIASIVLGILAATGAAVVLVIAVLIEEMQGGQIADDDPEMLLLIGVFLASSAFSFAGLILGIVGSGQSDRNPLLGVFGLVLNSLVLVGLIFLICLGVLSDF